MELLCDEHGERRTDSAADDAVQVEGPKGGVLAGPPEVLGGFAGSNEVSDDVAVGVGHAHLGHVNIRSDPLAVAFAQQVLRAEHG
jgi:hypothetical protein